MAKTRHVHKIIRSKSTIEGAGVHLKRAFGFSEAPAFDPFLLLDDFRGDRPELYIAGFPWHPHRGIETITYVLRGTVEHGDSLGNQGVIGCGDVQWMRAGSGIIHQEMPKGDAQGHMGGFQLWANLPASHKMSPPRYQEIKSQRIPVISTASGAKIRIIAGEVEGTRGPVRDVLIDPVYLDVTVASGSKFIYPTSVGHTVFAYVIEGKGSFCPAEAQDTSGDIHTSQALARIGDGTLILFDDGEQIVVSTEADPVRFLLISGKPIGEPVAWYGPIVMNTQEELQLAFEEFRNGTFVKQHKD